MATLIGGSGFCRHGARATFPTRLIEDPVFGLYFAPAKAHFDTMRLADMPEPCRNLLLSDYVPDARFFIFADAATPAARMLVLGDKFAGALLVIRAGQCQGGVLRASLQDGEKPAAPGGLPVLSPSDNRHVFADVLLRYTRAFAGKQRFLAWLDVFSRGLPGCALTPDTYCPPTRHRLPAELQDMLDTYRHS